MKINCTQRFLLFIFLCIFLFISKNGFTYSASKHHRHMGERATDESDLNRYLKDNLGFSNGINTTLTNPDEPIAEQTKKIYEWIGYGAAEEDNLFPIVRVVYHFYDPVSNLGLSDYAPFLDSSLVWGNDAPLNDYSWVDVRGYYYLALTSETKEERERYWALTFRSLGQVLHLIQDLASPAHVRNDNHLSLFNFDNDSYEDLWGTSPEGISFIHGALGNADYQYPAVGFDRFEDYWDTEDGRGLAEFTNSNFVSKDTNLDRPPGDPHHYDNPQATGEHRESFTFTDSTGRTRTMGVNYVTSNVVDNYAPGRSVNPFNYLTTHSFFNFYAERYDLNQRSYTLNRKCHEEYAKLLVPRTVGYGAGLLNYFFRGEIQLVNIGFQGRHVKFHLIGNFNLDDLYNFEVFYDDENTIRTGGDFYWWNDRYGDSSLGVERISDNEIWLRVPIPYTTPIRYIIVYDGPGIVVGKIINKAIVYSRDYPGGSISKGYNTGWESGSWSSVRSAAYTEFLNRPFSFYVSQGALIAAYWYGGGNYSVGTNEYDAGMYTGRKYINLGTFSYLSSFIVTDIKLYYRINPIWVQNGASASLSIYRVSSGVWPPMWDYGDQLLFTINGYSGDSMRILNLNFNSIAISLPNIWETKVVGVDPLANAIPESAPTDSTDPGGGFYLEYGVGTNSNYFYLVIDYQEQE